MAQSTRKSLAIAIVRFWCAKERKDRVASQELPRDSWETIVAEGHLDVAQAPLGRAWEPSATSTEGVPAVGASSGAGQRADSPVFWRLQYRESENLTGLEKGGFPLKTHNPKIGHRRFTPKLAGWIFRYHLFYSVCVCVCCAFPEGAFHIFLHLGPRSLREYFLHGRDLTNPPKNRYRAKGCFLRRTSNPSKKLNQNTLYQESHINP